MSSTLVQGVEEVWIDENTRGLIISISESPLVIFNIDVYYPSWPFKVDERLSVDNLSLVYYRSTVKEVLGDGDVGENVEFIGVIVNGKSQIIGVRLWINKRRLQQILSDLKTYLNKIINYIENKRGALGESDEYPEGIYNSANL